METDETPFFLSVSSSDDLHFDNRTTLGVDQGSLPVEYEPHGLRIVDANWRWGPLSLDSQGRGRTRLEKISIRKEEQGRMRLSQTSVAVSDMLAIPGRLSVHDNRRDTLGSTARLSPIYSTTPSLWDVSKEHCRPAQVPWQFCKRTSLHCSLPPASGQAEKSPTWAASCQVTVGRKRQMGWYWGKKKSANWRGKQSGRRMSHFGKTAPAVPFITAQKAVRTRWWLLSLFFPTRTHMCTHATSYLCTQTHPSGANGPE